MRTGGSTIYGERPARRPAADRRYARCDKGALEEGGPGVAVLASPEDGAPGRPAAPSKTWPIRRHSHTMVRRFSLKARSFYFSVRPMATPPLAGRPGFGVASGGRVSSDVSSWPLRLPAVPLFGV